MKNIRSIKYKLNMQGEGEEYIKQLADKHGHAGLPEDSPRKKMLKMMMPFYLKMFEDCKKRINEEQLFQYMLRKNNQEIIFTRKASKKGEDEINKINKELREKTTYYTNEKDEKVIEITSYSLKENEKVEYELEKFENDRKSIQGFDCYKLKLMQKLHTEEEIEWSQYEMYVTDKIKIPAHIVLELPTPIIEECPLEIKIIDLDLDSSFTMYYAIEVEEIVNKELQHELNQKWEIEAPFIKQKVMIEKRASIGELACSERQT